MALVTVKRTQKINDMKNSYIQVVVIFCGQNFRS